MDFFRDQKVIARLSDRRDGSCRLAPQEKDSLRNRAEFFKASGVLPSAVAGAMLVHGRNVRYAASGGIFPDTDGLITDVPGVFLSITVADCLPVFLYEPQRKMAGLLHAGWRGLAAGIIKEGVAGMVSRGAKPENILAALGPSIGPCHFEVQEDVLNTFRDYPEAVSVKGGRPFLDLRRIARTELLKAGLRAGNIASEAPCTACSRELFSWRRDKPERLQAMAAILGMSDAL